MSAPLFLSNNFIMKALGEKISLSPMKLQKLIYFTYRDYLRLTGNKLFTESICAWKFGPVAESVYNHFKPYGASSIDRFYKNCAGEVLILSEARGALANALKPVWERYRGNTGVELSNLARLPGAAWHKAWTSGRGYLDDEDIKCEGGGELVRFANING